MELRVRRGSGPPGPHLVDLAVALGGDPLAVAAILLLELVERLEVGRLAARRMVEDLPLGELRLVDPADLGDPGLLLVGDRALLDPLLPVLLLQAFQDQLVGALGGIVGQRGPPSESLSQPGLSGGEGSTGAETAGPSAPDTTGASMTSGCPQARPSWRRAG
jgi:hypothetical protein